MSEYGRLKEVVEEIASGVMNRATGTRKVHARLVSVEPLKFQLTDKLFIFGSALISPRFRVFRPDEIGKGFVFQEDAGGQQFIYLYEAAEPGKNGEEYRYESTHEITKDTIIGYVDSANQVHVSPGKTFQSKGTHHKGVAE